MSSVNLKRQQKINGQMKEVMDDFDRFEYFFASNWKRIVYAAIAVVVLVAVIVSIKYFSNKSALAAARAYDKAETVEQLQKAVNDHGKAPGAVYLRLAGMYIAQKDYANAAKQLKLAAADSKAPEIQWRAQLNMGYLAELEGKYAEAARMFADFAKSRREPGSAGYAAEAYAASGRLYNLAGQGDAAAAILKSGKSFIMGVSADERAVMQAFESMINSMLANPVKAAKSK